MAGALFQNQNIDEPLRKEVAFSYKGDLFKVHVHKTVEDNETVYLLYFKNNIEDTNKSLMKLVRNDNKDGTFNWLCKKDYFCVMNNEVASLAGAAIDSLLQEKV